ncbi:MAG: hypothetical protein U0V70_13950 [Terriglobia bacterium]
MKKPAPWLVSWTVPAAPRFRAMLESYRTLLLRIELRGFDVFQERVRLQPADFWRIAARSLTRW